MSSLKTEEEHRGPLAWMAGNSVAANLLMLILILGGLLYAYKIKKEVFPEFDMDIINVSVAYPGASPAEVEHGIILALEEAVRGVDGVKEVTGTATEGAGMVSVELILGTDLQKAYQDIQQEVDRISSFPDDAERPQVTVRIRRRDVISLSVYGVQDERVLRELAEQIRERLLESERITQVELDGIRDFEITAEISRDQLRTYGLTLSQVAAVIGQSAVEIPGGGIEAEGGEILMRMRERRVSARQFADIPIIIHPDGTSVLLGDIADIRDGFEESDESTTFNGQTSIDVEVYRVGDQTPTEVAAKAREIVKEVSEELPPGVSISVRRDMSVIYSQRMELLLRNGFIGLILVLVLLGLFLDARLAFWVTMGIPISFMGAFLFLPAMGVTINMITMFAFIIALGIVVDDAIVVGENIYEYRREGLPFLKAATRGVREVAMPVTFSVLTNVATFMPLLFISGFMGKVFKSIPYVVCTVFLVSLIECLLILPAHLGHKNRGSWGVFNWLHIHQQRFSDWFMETVRDVYGPVIRLVLRYRYVVIAAGFCLMLIIFGYIQSGRIGMILMPRTESDRAVVTVVLPYGVAETKTAEVRTRLVEAAAELIAEKGGDKLSTGINARIRANKVDVTVYLTDPEIRTMSTRDFAKEWRKRVGEITGSESSLFESDRGGPGSGASLTVELSHRSTKRLEEACRLLADQLDGFASIKDIDDGFAMGKEQLDFTLRPEGRSLGLTATDVARQVRAAFYGVRALRQQRGRNEVEVNVRLPESERSSEYDLNSLLIRTPGGLDVPLSEVVDINRGRAYREITRRNGRRTMTVTANVDPAEETSRILDAVTNEVLPGLVADISGLQFSFQGHQAEMADSMESLKAGFLIAMLVVYAMLAIPFRSYIQPLIIMVSIPFGIVGAVLGHIFMKYNLSIMSMMGLVALSGVVVNDSLVFIDFTNKLRRQGIGVFDALVQAGIRRFRPIMLTTLTTFGGLAPMIWETSRQARFMIPMAISLGYGILFATVITLLLVPCLYLVVEDIRSLQTRFSRMMWK